MQYLLPILLVAWWARTRGVRFFEAFALRRFDVGVGVSVAMGCAVAGRMVGIQYSVLMQQLGIRAPENLDVTRLFPVSPIGIAATVLASVVIAPLAEEVLFRGVVFAGLRDRWGQLAGILVSSGLFALVHLSAYQFVPVFILGMLLAVLASSTRSIWPSILCHALFNVPVSRCLPLESRRSAGMTSSPRLVSTRVHVTAGAAAFRGHLNAFVWVCYIMVDWSRAGDVGVVRRGIAVRSAAEQGRASSCEGDAPASGRVRRPPRWPAPRTRALEFGGPSRSVT